MPTRPVSQLSSIVRLLTGALLIVAAALAIFYIAMHPPMSDLGHMAQFLTVTAIVSSLIGYAAYRFGWMERSPGLRWTLLAGYGLASLLTFFNVWITARLMFASSHDLLLGTILLLFAGGIAMVLGYFISSTVTDRIARLDRAAREIQTGNLSVRLPVSGSDEIAGLARSFNQMAARLQEADARQRELDQLRRDLVAWAGHDLRTPLTGIRVLVEALADGVISDPETSQRYLQQARRQIDQLSRLIDDLFIVSQLDAGGIPLHIETASLADLISDTLESFSGLAERQEIHLDGTVSSGLDPVSIDVQAIGRVLNNLIGNALHHTPPGGTVTVDASAPGNSVRIEVRDTGEGILSQDLPHVFERFYRGEKSRSRATGGAGLGLAIAKGLIEAHGGTISVESQPGSGTRFVVDLPRKD
jgi:signal transduction histidine kinase